MVPKLFIVCIKNKMLYPLLLALMTRTLVPCLQKQMPFYVYKNNYENILFENSMDLNVLSR